MKNNTTQKKGQGHIEMIVSFVLFLSFVLAIFFFLYPIQDNSLDYSILNTVQEKIIENVSFNYLSSSLILGSSVNSGCFCVSNSVGFNSNILAKDSLGNVKPRGLGLNPANQSQILTIKIESTFNNRIYKLFSSEIFNQYASSCIVSSCLSEENYTFGPLSFERAILFENLVLLNEEYMKDYNSLRTRLGINRNFDFVILNNQRQVLLNDSLSMHNIKQSGVLARDIPLISINKNATFADIILHLEVW